VISDAISYTREEAQIKDKEEGCEESSQESLEEEKKEKIKYNLEKGGNRYGRVFLRSYVNTGSSSQ